MPFNTNRSIRGTQGTVLRCVGRKFMKGQTEHASLPRRQTDRHAIDGDVVSILLSMGCQDLVGEPQWISPFVVTLKDQALRSGECLKPIHKGLAELFCAAVLRGCLRGQCPDETEQVPDAVPQLARENALLAGRAPEPVVRSYPFDRRCEQVRIGAQERHVVVAEVARLLGVDFEDAERRPFADNDTLTMLLTPWRISTSGVSKRCSRARSGDTTGFLDLSA